MRDSGLGRVKKDEPKQEGRRKKIGVGESKHDMPALLPSVAAAYAVQSRTQSKMGIFAVEGGWHGYGWDKGEVGLLKKMLQVGILPVPEGKTFIPSAIERGNQLSYAGAAAAAAAATLLRCAVMRLTTGSNLNSIATWLGGPRGVTRVLTVARLPGTEVWTQS
ncbi:hypothetical protein AXG93_2016s1480 [Marchantia polymorpha subsp. ruderalis]|uniref:Uncharacterized protein n=1 Tax=Marchantia polymorpha subsp. ruderalis TaxID=1480154 RepID=A0A176VWG2_MARPO|nr:hypothetical protein AXG93_2016s1480 [Marchantia polymorpha subsp. ruderalis]